MGSCTSAAPKPCSAFPTGSNPSPAIAASTPSLAQHLPACRSSPPPADGAELRPVVVFRSRPGHPRTRLIPSLHLPPNEVVPSGPDPQSDCLYPEVSDGAGLASANRLPEGGHSRLHPW